LFDKINPVQETSGATVLANVLGGLGIDEPFARADTQVALTSYFVSDALGSIVAATDASGNVQTEYSYEPFGKTTVTGAFDNNRLNYTGRENDGTGLYYYRNRFYHPELQRFVSEDPIEFFGGDPNLYSYVINNPANFIDPSGLTWETNINFFQDWLLGDGQRKRFYGPNAIETQEMMISPGVQAIRDQFYKGNCQTINSIGYDTYRAYWDTWWNPGTADWSSTALQVGGFGGASIVNNGNGTATFTIPNTAGAHSFFLHLPPDRSSPTGAMSNIYQTFQWTESLRNNCGCQ
jgi:RHS repeat-associated protein